MLLQELRLLIEKEQASIQYLKVTQDELLESLGKHQMVNEDETFAHLMTIKQELYSTEQCIQELDHTLQQLEQKDPQYLSKQLDSLKLQTSNISFLIEAVDVLLKCTNESIFECYESIIANIITCMDKQFDILTWESREIVNLCLSMWNMALTKYTQGSKTASNWVQNNIVIPYLSWHEARDLFATHFGSKELQIHLLDEFFKLSHRPKELVRKVIKRIDNILQ
ncbi:hypothetical protein QOT17_019478 [Balamuthia mandrillaris]